MIGPAKTSRPALACFAAAAVAVAVAGVLHGRLYHQGYDEVYVVGPLFVLNVVGSAAVVLLLLARRTTLFALGALAISVGGDRLDPALAFLRVVPRVHRGGLQHQRDRDPRRGGHGRRVPRDYLKRLSGGEIRALSSFLHAAAG